MKNNFAKCGNDCMICPSFKDNLKTKGNRKACSDGWKKYLGFQLSPEKLRRCDGCSVEEGKRKKFYINCRVRKCAIINKIKNCAYCSAFPCVDVISIHKIQNFKSKEEAEKKLRISIPQKDFSSIIEPYMGLKNLEELRKKILPGEIKDFKKYSTEPKTVILPEFLHSEDLSSYKYLHEIISGIEVYENISYARYIALLDSREIILKILWAIGLDGIFCGEIEKYLLLNPDAFHAHKIITSLSRLNEYFKTLSSFGIFCEVIPTDSKKWLTPTGSLRSGNWHLKMWISPQKGGVLTINTLKNYTSILIEKYGKNAFNKFRKSDMSVLH